MRTADRRPRRRLSPAERRAELLAAGGRAFAAASYADVSVADVAAEVGASPALVHHHFGSKHGLYVAVLTEAADDLRRRLRAVADVAEPSERLRAGIGAFVGFVGERRVGWIALYRGRHAADPAVRALFADVRAEVLDVLRADAVAGGCAPGPALEIALRGYLGFVDEACVAWTEQPDGTPPELVVRAAHAALLAALRA
ncbi:TetR/AcrR family transcriptional regulator [Cryptosporangium phraense]|uniref:TetR family transcriptional regulator n=1 Tax=Cryptosporangium phraense TaxID=2593070 RepID=A0A545ALL4_9ACTN|nr:TetR/AcrR family transcriptional regulator [Cryptosporangium phraense]TQS42207.1 TetR family transcriptional regulator [Cryptosporangium phraense]